MEVKAKLRFLRMSPRKVRLVANLIKGMNVSEAINQLKFNPKLTAKPLLKLLNSAVANATNNFKLDKKNLFIKIITADQGPTLERWRPRAFGRATPIKKRTTHVNIVLDEIVPSKKTEIKEVKKTRPAETVVGKQPRKEIEKGVTAAREEKREAEDHQPEVFNVREKGKHRHMEHLDKKEMKKPKEEKGFIKKMFTRKSV